MDKLVADIYSLPTTHIFKKIDRKGEIWAVDVSTKITEVIIDVFFIRKF